MRHVPVVLGGQQWELPACFAALKTINDRVGDPYEMLMRASTLMPGEAPLRALDCVLIICTGLHQAGCHEPDEVIGQWIVDEGVIDRCTAVAMDYVTALLVADPEALEEVGENVTKKK